GRTTRPILTCRAGDLGIELDPRRPVEAFLGFVPRIPRGAPARVEERRSAGTDAASRRIAAKDVRLARRERSEQAGWPLHLGTQLLNRDFLFAEDQIAAAGFIGQTFPRFVGGGSVAGAAKGQCRFEKRLYREL